MKITIRFDNEIKWAVNNLPLGNVPVYNQFNITEKIGVAHIDENGVADITLNEDISKNLEPIKMMLSYSVGGFATETYLQEIKSFNISCLSLSIDNSCRYGK